MGLDAVEILMELEDAFEVTLDESDAATIDTPRDLIEAVMRKLKPADSTICLTQRAFNRVRKALLQHLPLKRRQVRPASRLKDLVPRDKRVPLWADLPNALNIGPLPELIRPPAFVALFAVFSLGLGLSAGLFLPRLLPAAGEGLRAGAGLAVAALAQTCFWIALTPLRKEFPSEVATVGDLSRWITGHTSDLADPATPGRWTREQVAARVREVLIEYLGCERNYREDASLVKDLGLR